MGCKRFVKECHKLLRLVNKERMRSKPNHDAFWAYRASLAAFIDWGNGKALDVGCGKVQMSRMCGSTFLPISSSASISASGSSVPGV